MDIACRLTPDVAWGRLSLRACVKHLFLNNLIRESFFQATHDVLVVGSVRSQIFAHWRQDWSVPHMCILLNFQTHQISRASVLASPLFCSFSFYRQFSSFSPCCISLQNRQFKLVMQTSGFIEPFYNNNTYKYEH